MHPWVAEQAHQVRFGIATHPRADWSVLRGFVRDVETLGFDSIWFPDHPVWSPDCFVTLAAVAAATERLRVGSSVACVYYRNPLVIARAADVDRVSEGRFVLRPWTLVVGASQNHRRLCTRIRTILPRQGKSSGCRS